MYMLIIVEIIDIVFLFAERLSARRTPKESTPQMDAMSVYSMYN